MAHSLLLFLFKILSCDYQVRLRKLITEIVDMEKPNCLGIELITLKENYGSLSLSSKFLA